MPFTYKNKWLRDAPQFGRQVKRLGNIHEEAASMRAWSFHLFEFHQFPA
jgi:hypothetical protein